MFLLTVLSVISNLLAGSPEMPQRPTYVEVGPLMTIRFGEVRWSSSWAGANNLINADLTALIWA